MKIIDATIGFLNRHMPSSNKLLKEEAEILEDGVKRVRTDIAKLNTHVDALWQRIADDLSSGGDKGHKDRRK